MWLATRYNDVVSQVCADTCTLSAWKIWKLQRPKHRFPVHRVHLPIGPTWSGGLHGRLAGKDCRLESEINKVGFAGPGCRGLGALREKKVERVLLVMQDERRSQSCVEWR